MKKPKMICTACGGEYKDDHVHQCADCEAWLCDGDREAHTKKACEEFKRLFANYRTCKRLVDKAKGTSL